MENTKYLAYIKYYSYSLIKLFFFIFVIRLICIIHLISINSEFVYLVSECIISEFYNIVRFMKNP